MRVERIFASAAPAEGDSLAWLDPAPGEGREQRAAKRLRREALARGEWEPVVVWAAADLAISLSDGSEVLHRVESPGMWSLPSDAPDELEEAAKVERGVLREMLEAFGAAWDPAVEEPALRYNM